MKTIFRTKQSSNFTVLPNQMLRDTSISIAARGLLAMILSHSEEWEVHNKWLEEQTGLSRGAVSKSVRALEAAGYAVYVQERSDKGTFLRAIWTFHQVPVPVGERSSPNSRGGIISSKTVHTTKILSPVILSVDIRPPKKKHQKEETLSRRNKSPNSSGVALPDRKEFEDFCEARSLIVQNFRDFDDVDWSAVEYDWKGFVLGLNEDMETLRNHH